MSNANIDPLLTIRLTLHAYLPLRAGIWRCEGGSVRIEMVDAHNVIHAAMVLSHGQDIGLLSPTLAGCTWQVTSVSQWPEFSQTQLHLLAERIR